jgi:hypothetical protein
MRDNDMSDVKALKIAGRRKNGMGKRMCGPNSRGNWLMLRRDGENREEEFRGKKRVQGGFLYRKLEFQLDAGPEWRWSSLTYFGSATSSTNLYSHS